MEQKDRGEQAKQEYARQITTEYGKPVYGFALRRTASLQDAEDLAQEICLKLYKALSVREDILSVDKFVWAIAHNTLVNYYKDSSRWYINCGGNMEDLSDVLASDEILPEDKMIEKEQLKKLQSEIAYLSKMQRNVITLYYYAGKKQSEISGILGVPLGTVKWHLSEARTELKKGMDTMRNASELKFNPIKFTIMGLNGSVGTMGGTDSFFRSTLSQNIAYCVYREAKTINEIADCLGVSPVYVESEAEFLEEYGFLLKKGDKYLTNFIIDEPDRGIIDLQDEMYSKAAKLISNELFDELMKSEHLASDKLYFPDGDKNFLAWALLLFMLAWGNQGVDEPISFDEVATMRKDGAKNIAYAGFAEPGGPEQKYFNSIRQWCGPCWNTSSCLILWQIDSEWSEKRVKSDYQNMARRDLKLLERFLNKEPLSQDEYADMAQRGYIKGENGDFQLAVVWLKDKEILQSFLALSAKVKANHKAEIQELKDKFCQAVLGGKPSQIQRMQAYGLQYIFCADGWFLLYTVKELLQNKRLKLPAENQRISLSTVILPKE